MATESGADDSSQIQDEGLANRTPIGKPVPKRDPVLSARDKMLEDIDAQIVARREAENAEFLRGADPRAAAFYAEMQAESAGATQSADETQTAEPSADVESRPIAEPVRDEKGRFTAQVQADGTDPLADWIVREGDQPMFKTIVDGKVRLIPLETARAQLQKHLVADTRLEQATLRRRELDAREAQLRQREQAALTSRAQPQPAVDDKALEAESIELVRSLVNEPETVAAQKLAKTLAKVRATAPVVDVNAISRQAALVAKQELAAENNARALSTGLSEFQKSYPDIVEGSELYWIADRKTTAIAEEHPDWTPGQVMMEAGKRTMEWWTGKPAPAAKGSPVVQLSQDRQQRKENLRPMPTSRSARPAPASDPNEGTSPQDALADIRKARGQAY